MIQPQTHMESVEVKDEDLVLYIKNILQSRILPISYMGLRDLVKHAPVQLKEFTEHKYNGDCFLNFLLSHPDIFNVSSDGTVALIGSVEYVFPQGVDTVDSVAGISDDSYFGDREEYISDSDNDSHTSVSSSDECMLQKDSAFSDNMQQAVNKAFLSKLNENHREGERNTTSSSGSSQDYLSSASESGGSTSGGTNSSFESCNERENNSRKSKNSTCSNKTSGSSSYSSCSES